MAEELALNLLPPEDVTVTHVQESIELNLITQEQVIEIQAVTEIIESNFVREDISLEVVGQIGPPGPQGPPGPAGPSGGTGAIFYLHQQNAPANDWVIAHNLGFWPSIRTYDSAGTEVMGDVVHVDTNSAVVHFDDPFGGTAWCT